MTDVVTGAYDDMDYDYNIENMETQYLYYYDPIEQTDIKTNISIVVTAPKTLKIKWYSVNNYRYSIQL